MAAGKQVRQECCYWKQTGRTVDCLDFNVFHSVILTLRYAISKEDDILQRAPGNFHQSLHRFLHHRFEVANDLLARILQLGDGPVFRCEWVQVIHQCNRRRLVNARPWVTDVRTCGGGWYSVHTMLGVNQAQRTDNHRYGLGKFAHHIGLSYSRVLASQTRIQSIGLGQQLIFKSSDENLLQRNIGPVLRSATFAQSGNFINANTLGHDTCHL